MRGLEPHQVAAREGPDLAVEGADLDVGRRLAPLLDDADAARAVGYLREDFATIDAVGPVRASIFLDRQADEGFRADVAGLVERLLGTL